MPGSHAASSPSTSRAATSHLPAGILRAIALQSLLSAGETHAVGLTGDPAVGLHVVLARRRHRSARALAQSCRGFSAIHPEHNTQVAALLAALLARRHSPSSKPPADALEQGDGLGWPLLRATRAAADPAELELAHSRAHQLLTGGHGAIVPDQQRT